MTKEPNKPTRQMDPAAQEAIDQYNKLQEDWEATCKKCGAPLKGKLEDLRSHCCG